VARYPATGRVYFLLDVDGVRIYQDEENFDLGGGDSILFDWPVICYDPGYYAAKDSLVVDLGKGDSTVVWWKFWVVASGTAGPPGAPCLAATGAPTIVRGVLLLAEASSRRLQAASLVDISGRAVMALKPGANHIRHLSPGVYFVRAAAGDALPAATRVVVLK